MSHVRRTQARLFRTTAQVERRTAERNRRASQHVGSGALLGGLEKCRTWTKERTRLRKNTVRGIERVAKPPRAGTKVEALGMRQNSPGHLIRRLHPIRAFEESPVSSGEGAINCQASHGRPACLIVFGVTSDVNCEIGAETPNVKDEPRPQRARCVQQNSSRSRASFRKKGR